MATLPDILRRMQGLPRSPIPTDNGLPWEFGIPSGNNDPDAVVDPSRFAAAAPLGGLHPSFIPGAGSGGAPPPPPSDASADYMYNPTPDVYGGYAPPSGGQSGMAPIPNAPPPGGMPPGGGGASGPPGMPGGMPPGMGGGYGPPGMPPIAGMPPMPGGIGAMPGGGMGPPPPQPQEQGGLGGILRRLGGGLGGVISGAIQGAATPNIAYGGPTDILRAMAGAQNYNTQRNMTQYEIGRQRMMDAIQLERQQRQDQLAWWREYMGERHAQRQDAATAAMGEYHRQMAQTQEQYRQGLIGERDYQNKVRQLDSILKLGQAGAHEVQQGEDTKGMTPFTDPVTGKQYVIPAKKQMIKLTPDLGEAANITPDEQGNYMVDDYTYRTIVQPTKQRLQQQQKEPSNEAQAIWRIQNDPTLTPAQRQQKISDYKSGLEEVRPKQFEWAPPKPPSDARFVKLDTEKSAALAKLKEETLKDIQKNALDAFGEIDDVKAAPKWDTFYDRWQVIQNNYEHQLRDLGIEPVHFNVEDARPVEQQRSRRGPGARVIAPVAATPAPVSTAVPQAAPVMPGSPAAPQPTVTPQPTLAPQPTAPAAAAPAFPKPSASQVVAPDANTRIQKGRFNINGKIVDSVTYKRDPQSGRWYLAE